MLVDLAGREQERLSMCRTERFKDHPKSWWVPEKVVLKRFQKQALGAARSGLIKKGKSTIVSICFNSIIDR